MRNEFTKNTNPESLKELKKPAIAASALLGAYALVSVINSGQLDRAFNEDAYQKACQEFSHQVHAQYEKNKDAMIGLLIENKDVVFTYPEYTPQQLKDVRDPVSPVFHARKPSGYSVEARALLDQNASQEKSSAYVAVPQGSVPYVCEEKFPEEPMADPSL